MFSLSSNHFSQQIIQQNNPCYQPQLLNHLRYFFNMCLEVRDQYKCLHRGPKKGYEYCIWQMRAKRMPAVKQTEMTLEQNISRCASASTERYDYRKDVCPACKEKNESEEKEYQNKLARQEEFRAKQRAGSMRSDYDHRQNIAQEQARLNRTYADFEQRSKEARDREASDMRESAERQYRAQGFSHYRISQLLWSNEERRKWERKEKERLAEGE
jgi:hypothetical protein